MLKIKMTLFSLRFKRLLDEKEPIPVFIHKRFESAFLALQWRLTALTWYLKHFRDVANLRESTKVFES